jgi:hypothetical protein
MTDYKECFFIARSISTSCFCYFYPFPIERIKGWSNNYFVLFRYAGFFLKQLSTKLASSELPLVSFGGSLFTIHCMARWCFMRRNGGSPYTSSIATIPKDQISTFSSYAYFLINSGAIQAGVPTNDFLLRIYLVNCMANPKSAIFTYPLRFIKTLSLFRSLCNCLRLCKLYSPSSIFFSM